jgi:hypothetical protein
MTLIGTDLLTAVIFWLLMVYVEHYINIAEDENEALTLNASDFTVQVSMLPTKDGP